MAPARKRTGERRQPARAGPEPASQPAPPAQRRSQRGSHDGGGRRGKGGRRGRFGRFLYWSVVLALWMVIGAVGVVTWVGLHLPPIHSLEIPKRPPGVKIFGLDARLLATRGDMGGAVPLGEMPAHLPAAFIAIEDRRFYSHRGIDPLALLRAAGANLLRRGISQGGSTITQQLAKNLFLTQERTVMRKLEEAILALWLEHKFSKKEILELYLNRIYFGSGAYGVEAAAQRYFGKSARQLTVAESALLAGLVKSPSRLAPTRNYHAAEQRAKVVLLAMSNARLISEAAARTAMLHPPKIVKPTRAAAAGYVADWVMDVVNELVGRVEDDLIVETTIDATLQAAAEKALADELAHKGEKFGVEQAALVAMTPAGAVRALVGGRNYAESQFNRAVAAKRQPGSAFKPFVYLTAIERGLTPETVREDKPIVVKGWRPENYRHEYFGAVTLGQALAQSLNTVSVRLTLEFGPTAVVKTAHRLGVSSKLEPNASIALGTSEVSLIELVSAYAPFANGGNAIVPHVVETVRTPEGRTLYARTPATLGRVIEARYVAMMNAMMRETVRSGTARRAELPGWAPAGKTGTSQDFRDAWFVGYTGHLVAGVWFGNDDSSPTRKATGGGLPVEAWRRFMTIAHRGLPAEEPPVVSGSPPVVSGSPLVVTPAPPGAGPAQAARANGGMDGWFLDRLFSRR